MNDILKISNLTKSYPNNKESLQVLQNINFTIKQGESVSIVGPSGSGKTTLLGLSAGLDNPTSGSIDLFGNEISKMTEDEKADVRNKYVGFIFQNFQLIPTLTALENVMIPLELNKVKDARKTAMDLLERVGLGNRSHHYPTQLSGGEQQRVSLARAFVNKPAILFADEPTGNLDSATGEKIESLLFEMNKENNTTLIIVTHDLELATKTDRVIKLKAGQIVSDEYKTTVV